MTTKIKELIENIQTSKKQKTYMRRCTRCNSIYISNHKKGNICNDCNLNIQKFGIKKYLRRCKNCNDIYQSEYRNGSICDKCKKIIPKGWDKRKLILQHQ